MPEKRFGGEFFSEMIRVSARKSELHAKSGRLIFFANGNALS